MYSLVTCHTSRMKRTSTSYHPVKLEIRLWIPVSSSWRDKWIPFCGSFDDRGLTKMTVFHGDSPAALTDVFHGCQFIFANVAGIYIRCTAKTAIGFISAGVAQVAGFICYSSAIFTRVCHDASPFQFTCWIRSQKKRLHKLKMKNISVNLLMIQIGRGSRLVTHYHGMDIAKAPPMQQTNGFMIKTGKREKPPGWFRCTGIDSVIVGCVVWYGPNFIANQNTFYWHKAQIQFLNDQACQISHTIIQIFRKDGSNE